MRRPRQRIRAGHLRKDQYHRGKQHKRQVDKQFRLCIPQLEAKRHLGRHDDNRGNRVDYKPRREGSFSDRPKRDFGDRPARREGGFGDRQPRSFDDRPKRSFGGEDRPRREFNSDRPRREGGFDRPRRKFND